MSQPNENKPLGGVITTANLPTPPPEAAPVIEDETIVAKPLGDIDLMNLVPSNPNIAIRGINRSAGGGQRYDQALSQGFVPCSPADILDCPKSFKRDGKVINGDLIFMKIDRKEYLGALKFNEQKARDRVASPLNHGEGTLAKEFESDRTPESVQRKIRVFDPSDKEKEALANQE